MWVGERDRICLAETEEEVRIKKLTGVKANEILMWLTLTEISVDDLPSGKIQFKTLTWLSCTFPVEAL
ncbi:hypothetical protein ACS0TY_034599 [Phlomoides rotata]